MYNILHCGWHTDFMTAFPESISVYRVCFSPAHTTFTICCWQSVLCLLHYLCSVRMSLLAWRTVIPRPIITENDGSGDKQLAKWSVIVIMPSWIPKSENSKTWQNTQMPALKTKSHILYLTRWNEQWNMWHLAATKKGKNKNPNENRKFAENAIHRRHR